jgi:hypothetical protein
MFDVEQRFAALRRLLLVSGLLLLAAGCTVPATGPQIPYTGDPVKDGLAWIEKGPSKDRVLWQYRTALHAMRRSDFQLAAQLLDDAILTLGAMMQPDASARKARGYFSEEAKKTFYGEPYERVMAWYYRGILYWMQGQPDNARACFRSAQFQDADAENNEYKSDYVALDYLEGLITEKLGGDGSDALERARELSKLSRLPDYNPAVNVLLFIDFGAGPRKMARGEYGEQLYFGQTPTAVRSARLTIGDQTLPVSPTDDLYYQATTRGGRVMDHVLGNKAVFKKSTDTLGNAALISGAVLATNDDTQEAGLAVLGVGILAKMFAAATKPEADTRAWQNLPQFLSFAVLELPPGAHQLTIDFLTSDGQIIGERRKVLDVAVVAGRDNVFYVSDQSTATPVTPANSATP